VEKLKEKGILCFATGKQSIRFVVHLDVSKEMVERTVELLKLIS
jgi:threonine aldolase